MKRILRTIALLLAIGAAITWLTTGANRGWTKTSFPVTTIDPVTGLEGIEYQQRFIPGLDFIGGALLGASLLAGASFLVRKPRGPTRSQRGLETRHGIHTTGQSH